MSFFGASVLQGTEDEVIDIRHGKRLHELAKLKSQPLWAEGHNHQVGMHGGDAGLHPSFCEHDIFIRAESDRRDSVLPSSGGSMQNLEMADGYLPALKRFMKEVWPECNPR
jgi:hypothetical protein